MGETAEQNHYRKQLRMIWPADKTDRLPVSLPEGYILRIYRDSDVDNYLALMHEAGFTDSDYEFVEKMKRSLLPGSFFLIEHTPDNELAATAMANHQPIEPYPRGGAVNWVAGAKRHKSKGLGLAVVSAVLNRLLACGYRDIYLTTDDYRLPALKTYLKLGFLPDLFSDDMQERWNRAYEKLNWF